MRSNFTSMLLTAVTLAILAGSGCTKDSPTQPQVLPGAGKISLSFIAVPQGIASIIAALSRQGYDTLRTHLIVSDTGRSASGTFENVAAGVWHLNVDAYDAANVPRYSGEADVDVRSHETTYAAIRLHILPATGTLEITVTWDSDSCSALPPGLVAWWTGDSTFTEIMGNVPFTTYGDVHFTHGFVGEAFNFSSSGGIHIPDDDRFKITGSLTVEAWVTEDEPPPAGSYGSQILFRGDDRAANDPYTLVVKPDGNLEFGISGDIQRQEVRFPLSLHQWVHVAGVFDSSAHELRLYQNGVLVAHETTSLHPFRDLDPAYHPGLGIGNTQATLYDEPWLGMIDEVSLYNRALAGSEIKAIYDAGASGKCRR